MRSLNVRLHARKSGYLGLDLSSILNTVNTVADTGGKVLSAVDTGVDTYNSLTAKPASGYSYNPELSQQQNMINQYLANLKAKKTAAAADEKQKQMYWMIGLGGAGLLGVLYLMNKKKK